MWSDGDLGEARSSGLNPSNRREQVEVGMGAPGVAVRARRLGVLSPGCEAQRQHIPPAVLSAQWVLPDANLFGQRIGESDGWQIKRGTAGEGQVGIPQHAPQDTNQEDHNDNRYASDQFGIKPGCIPTVKAPHAPGCMPDIRSRGGLIRELLDRIPKRHGGGSGALDRDEVLMKVLKNEYILNPRATRAIGKEPLDYMNATGRIPGLSVSVPITVNGPASKRMISDLRTEMEDAALRVMRRHS